MRSLPTRRYAVWLWLLLGLFLFRVVAQPLTLLVHSRFLPPFESWYSGALSYPALIVSQLLILIWLLYTSRQFTNGDVKASARLGVTMLIFGAAYFILMLLRLVLGTTLLSGQRWFASPVPTFFHLVLATYLLVYGHFHFYYGSGESRRCAL